MYIREANEEDLLQLRYDCIKEKGIGWSGFSKVNFIDYSKYIDKLCLEFPDLIFTLKDYGISVDRREEE